MAPRTVMIVGAAEEHCFGIRAARAAGLDVLVTDGDPDAPGFALADAAHVVSTYDHEGTLGVARAHLARGGRIDGVMTLAADVPYTVAHVAEALGLPGIGRASAALAADKVRMREAFARHGVPGPTWTEVREESRLAAAAAACALPVIVKPADSRGARGVQRIVDRRLLPEAFRLARHHSPTGRVLLEEYLPGPQLSVEGLMLGGEAYLPAIFDRNYEHLERFAPFVVEDGGEMPSEHSDVHGDAVRSVMRAAARALGIETGVVKGDLVVRDGCVAVIEIAARLSGGFFGTVATPVSSGVDLVGATLALCLGDHVDPARLRPRWQRGAAIRFALPRPGRLRRVEGLERVRGDPSCRYAHVFTRPGDRLAPITDHPARPAVVVAEGAGRREAAENARRLVDSLRWEIDDVG